MPVKNSFLEQKIFPGIVKIAFQRKGWSVPVGFLLYFHVAREAEWFVGCSDTALVLGAFHECTPLEAQIILWRSYSSANRRWWTPWTRYLESTATNGKANEPIICCRQWEKAISSTTAEISRHAFVAFRWIPTPPPTAISRISQWKRRNRTWKPQVRHEWREWAFKDILLWFPWFSVNRLGNSGVIQRTWRRNNFPQSKSAVNSDSWENTS